MLQIWMMSVLAGIAVGFPAGPTGAICTSYAMRGELVSALAGGVGAAVALGVWGAMAGFGLSALGGWVPIDALRIVGGLLLVVIGVVMWLRAPPGPIKTKPAAPTAVMTLTFTVVISNPAGLALLAAVMAAPLADVPWSPMTSAGLVGGGVAVGTALAFTGMMPVMFKLGERVGDRVRTGILRVLAVGVGIAGVLIVGFTAKGML